MTEESEEFHTFLVKLSVEYTTTEDVEYEIQAEDKEEAVKEAKKMAFLEYDSDWIDIEEVELINEAPKPIKELPYRCPHTKDLFNDS